MQHPQEWVYAVWSELQCWHNRDCSLKVSPPFKNNRQTQGGKWPCQSQSIGISKAVGLCYILYNCITVNTAHCSSHKIYLNLSHFSSLHPCFVSFPIALTQTPFEQCTSKAYFFFWFVFKFLGISLPCLESNSFFFKWQNRSGCNFAVNQGDAT